MKEIYDLLVEGYEIQFKRLSLCTISRYNKKFYQVHSDDSRNLFSELYRDPIDAVVKFGELKKELYQ